jgi:hypothetical protein
VIQGRSRSVPFVWKHSFSGLFRYTKQANSQQGVSLKAIFTAARKLIQHSARPSHIFAEGADGLPAAFCKALLKFELHNRGHQHLLTHDALRSTSTRDMPWEESPHNARRTRNTIAASFLDLYHDVMHRDLPRCLGLSVKAQVDELLNAQDELGYIETLTKFELRSFCETESFTGRTCFDIVALRLEADVKPVVLHLRIRTRDGKTATRSMKLDRGNLTTLGGARLLLNQACVKLEPMLEDVSTWPEFQPEAVPTPVTEPHQEETVPSPAPTQPQPELEDPDVAAFMARLQHDMRGFLNAYSPLTRAFMDKHWDSFRSIVNEPST